MTFIPIPYEQITDELLTALTGGVTREEHRFLGPKLPYALESKDAIPSSLKVSGQRGEMFVTFTRGIDYDLSQDAEILWRPGPDARPPDEQSFFSVSYYRAEAPRRLTDRNPGSVTATLAQAFAREFAVLQKQMEMIYRSAFVDLATDTSLDHVAALLALDRRDARFAVGEVTFRRSTPAPGDIAIPVGAVVTADGGQNFETTDDRVMRRGQLAVIVPVRAQTEGPGGLVPRGAIKYLSRPIFGVDSVSNEEATNFATARETDEEFRRRIRGTLERAGKATVEAIKLTLIERVPGVNDTNVQVVERADAPGVVEVKFGLPAVNQELVRRVDEAIFAARPAGVRVSHNLPRTAPQLDTIRLPAGASVRNGAAKELGVSVLNRFPEGLLAFQVSAAVRLAEPDLPVSQQEAIKESVRQRVVDYFATLPMGADVIFSKVLGHVVDDDRIADASVRIGPALSGVTPQYQENLATEGRKASVEPIAVDVSLMIETVDVEVLVRVVADGPVRTTSKNAATEAVARLLGEVNAVSPAAGRRVAKKAVAQAVAAALSGPVTDDAILLNARYVDTGRVLANTDDIALAANHLARVKEVVISPVEPD
jgi:uncharacterized phage protein gp47/JayE